MKNVEQAKTKFVSFLITAILILFVGFMIISCGTAVEKALNLSLGQCAIDFSRVSTGETLRAMAQNADFPSIAGNELTVEAWVKPVPTGTAAAGGLFGRYDAKGVFMKITSSRVPQFGIRIMTFPTTTAISPYDESPAYVEYQVAGTPGTALVANEWSHVAGVLAYEDHSATGTNEHGVCVSGATAAANAQMPHLDIYINGAYVDCATVYGGTWGTSSNPDTHLAANKDQHVEDPFINIYGADADIATIGYETAFDGIIDEVRLWTTARTASNIDECKGQELTSGSGVCGINRNILKGYWRFNECTAAESIDWSGGGSNVFTYVYDGASEHVFTDGWVTGAPITRAQ